MRSTRRSTRLKSDSEEPAATPSGVASVSPVATLTKRKNSLECTPLLAENDAALGAGSSSAKAIGETTKAANDEPVKHGFRFPLVKFEDLPIWMQDNDFIRDHYRPPLHSLRACALSMFRVHTETGNIWTHFLGFLIFIGITIGTYVHYFVAPSLEIKACMGVFLFGAMLCLYMSTMFHTCSAHSLNVLKVTSRCDYAGIAVLISASIVPVVDYCFYCATMLKIIYFSLLGLFGTTTIVVTMIPAFDTPKFRTTRLLVFIALGATGIFPVIHSGILYGFDRLIDSLNMQWVAISCAIYLIGGTIYAARVPERWFPGRCDLVGQGHQIFHVCVVVAAYMHYRFVFLGGESLVGATCGPDGSLIRAAASAFAG